MKINKEEFNDKKFNNVKTTVGAIIVKNRKVLIGKRISSTENNKWALIGGHIEIGETAEEGIRREVFEETSLKLNNLKFLFYWDEFVPRIKMHAILLIFYAKPIGVEKLNEENSEFAWIGQEDLDKYDFAFEHKKIIERYWRENE